MRLAVALTRCPFNNSDPVHLQILQTIYKQLTGDRFDCPRYGLELCDFTTEFLSGVLVV